VRVESEQAMHGDSPIRGQRQHRLLRDQALTELASTVYGRIKRSNNRTGAERPSGSGRIPGRTAPRLATLALWRLHRVWRSHPSLVEESRTVYEAYEARGT